ncbi:unnamed protein product [Mytilus coruscus]|uniref:LRAT domain-containing protein n=1 Tax=Mytilus coruscus TaxID=42192 RepID=A0A6J8B106_MYTCO|nr:unnamed protein product [Mytilus coruscus]
MDDNSLLEDTSRESYRREGTSKSESLLKDATEDDTKEKDTYSNQQAVIYRKDFDEEHLETVNVEAQFEPLGQNDTDTVNQSEVNVFFYSINDKSDSVISKENENQQRRTGDIYPTTAISTLEDSQMMQRPPSHITVANWTKGNTPARNVKPLILDTISEKAGDLGIADIAEKNSPFNINIESTSESILVENENNYLFETKNGDGIEPNTDRLSLGMPDDDTDSKDLQTSLQSLKHDESEDVRSCMDCIKPVQVKTWKEINQGDHIILSRSFYDHHAIVSRVIPPEDDNSQQISLELIHQTNKGAIRDSFRRRGGPIVKLKRKTETVDLKTVMICKYWGQIKPKSPEEIVKRASEALDGKQEEFRYDIIDNNCEHFASWCVTGRRLSIQIRKARIVLKILFRKRFHGLSDELLRNKVEYEHGMLCKMCFERNEKMLSVTRKKVLQKDDIQKGDILLYRYYKLLHCSVVLDVIKRKEKYIKCEIAHYAFKGPFTKKKIQSDILKVPFNGSVSVFDYSNDEFKTYKPEEVIYLKISEKKRDNSSERENISGDATEDQTSDLAANISQHTITNPIDSPIDSKDEHIHLLKGWNGKTHVDDSVNQSHVKVFININDKSESNIFMEIENQQEKTRESNNATSNGTQSNDNEVCQETETYKKYQMDDNVKTDKSPDELNFIYPTTESSILEDCPIMQRAPSHITIAKWTKTNTHSLKVKPLDLETISEEVDIISRHNSQTSLVCDLDVDDIAENGIRIGNSTFYINIESTSESIHKMDKTDNLFGKMNDDEVESKEDRLSWGVSDDDTDSKDLQTSLQSLKHDESEAVGSCMDCIKPVQVKTWKEINQGDHIILSRSFYDHHAIVIRIIPPEDDQI